MTSQQPQIFDSDTTLKTLLAKQTISLAEARDGVTACFIVINREFARRRMGQRPISEIDTATWQIIQQIFTDLHLNDNTLTLNRLRQAWKVLTNQFSFEAEPDLNARHHQIIEHLLHKTEAGQIDHKRVR